MTSNEMLALPKISLFEANHQLHIRCNKPEMIDGTEEIIKGTEQINFEPSLEGQPFCHGNTKTQNITK